MVPAFPVPLKSQFLSRHLGRWYSLSLGLSNPGPRIASFRNAFRNVFRNDVRAGQVENWGTMEITRTWVPQISSTAEGTTVPRVIVPAPFPGEERPPADTFQKYIPNVAEARLILNGLHYLAPELKHASAISSRSGLRVEVLDLTGNPICSFKFRGAYVILCKMANHGSRPRLVLASSAGNHAQGLAIAAAAFRIKAVIYVPETIVDAKREAIERHGGDWVKVKPVKCGGFEAARLAAEAEARSKNCPIIPPYDHEDVVSANGVIVLELMDRLLQLAYNPPEVLLVPVGGGGLLAGVLVAIKILMPKTRVIGVCPVGSAGMVRSLLAGRVVTLDTVSTAADGVAVKRVGDITFAIVRDLADAMVTVTEEEIAEAQRLIYKDLHLVTEPAGALTVAAVLSHTDQFRRGSMVVPFISGGNTDVSKWAKRIAGGIP